MLSAYNDTPIPVISRCVTDMHRKKTFPFMFVVADTESCPIIGLNTCERLNFIKQIVTVNSSYSDLIDEFSDTESCPIIGLNTCERLNFIKQIVVTVT